MLRGWWRRRHSSSSRFQSSPDPKAGCYFLKCLPPVVLNQFQSSPDPKAGCYLAQVGRANIEKRFQSSPDPKAGCYPIFQLPQSHKACFNPHPTRRPGATQIAQKHILLDNVSILTRPEGRVLRLLLHLYSFWVSCFNPHPTRRPGATKLELITIATTFRFQSSPDPKAGCYTTVFPSTRSLGTFQSSPDPKAGCYQPSSRTTLVESGFNPHPTRRPGATVELEINLYGWVVSILTRPEGRVLRTFVTFTTRPAQLVSILTRPEGRVLLTEGSAGAERSSVSILTRPEGRVLPIRAFGPMSYPTRFQSSPDPKAGCYHLHLPQVSWRVARFNPHPTRRPGATAIAL